MWEVMLVGGTGGAIGGRTGSAHPRMPACVCVGGGGHTSVWEVMQVGGAIHGHDGGNQVAHGHERVTARPYPPPTHPTLLANMRPVMATMVATRMRMDISASPHATFWLINLTQKPAATTPTLAMMPRRGYTSRASAMVHTSLARPLQQASKG